MDPYEAVEADLADRTRAAFAAWATELAATAVPDEGHEA